MQTGIRGIKRKKVWNAVNLQAAPFSFLDNLDFTMVLQRYYRDLIFFTRRSRIIENDPRE